LLRVGLTGGVACGKSTVGAMLERRGAKWIDADNIVHDLLCRGQAVYDGIVKHFGPGVVDKHGNIDRKKLADVAFGGNRIRELNQIVHPAVIAEQDRVMNMYAAGSPDGIAVVEAALLFEAAAAERFDKMVVVTCSREQKIARFARRHALDYAAAEREVDRRMAAQWPDERKASAADYVIDNSGSLAELESQVDHLYRELKKAAALKSSNPGRETRNLKP
jgi:dephospho-CoA kinase